MGNPKNEVFIRFMVILQNPNYKNQAKGVFPFRFIEIRETRSDIIPLERSFSGWFIHILRNRPETNETLACEVLRFSQTPGQPRKNQRNQSRRAMVAGNLLIRAKGAFPKPYPVARSERVSV
jgi:hypothetical protein